MNSHYQKRAAIYGIVGIVAGVIAIKLFFNPFFKYSYVLTVSLVGLSTYFVLQFMIYYEDSSGYTRLFNPLIWMDGKSFYIYLIHFFFVDFVATVKRTLNNIGVTGDSYIVFFALMPVVILLSYYTGCILRFIVKKITHAVFKKTANL